MNSAMQRKDSLFWAFVDEVDKMEPLLLKLVCYECQERAVVKRVSLDCMAVETVRAPCVHIAEFDLLAVWLAYIRSRGFQWEMSTTLDLDAKPWSIITGCEQGVWELKRKRSIIWAVYNEPLLAMY